jgi:type I restriction enzyme S subunit
MAMYGATIGKASLLGIEATVNQACCVLPPSVKANENFLLHFLISARNHLISLATGGGQPNINQDIVRSLRIPLPPVEEQSYIATFLDHETAKIDALIAEQQRLIELLQEKRQAVISHAVTKGLNPDAPMKDSGVEWLGEVPEHWKVLPIFRTARQDHKSFDDGDWIESPYIQDDGIRLIQTGNIGVGEFREKGFRFISEDTFETLGCTEVHTGDLLICRLDGPVGRACLAPQMNTRMITSVDNAILRVGEQVVPEFLMRVFSSHQWLDWIQAICRVGGGFRLRISRTQLGEQRVCLPPRQEQAEICRWISSVLAVEEPTKQQAMISIELLQERRSALISAAVTGQIDVRGLVPEASAA